MAGLPQPISHMTASFSPDTYDVQAEVVLSHEEELCNSVSSRYMIGKVVFALRGNCTFIEKAINAEAAGAVALVVGNYIYRGSELIRMGVSVEYPLQQLSMPSVFIRGPDYAAAVAVLRNWTKARGEGTGPQARLNAVGLVFDPEVGQLSSVQLVAFLLLLLPLVWCVVACIFCLRKSCVEAINHHRRTRRMATMPVVQFQASAVDRAGARTQIIPQDSSSAHIHNDSCAICLDDFTESEPVQLLPCGHGYHPSCVHPWLARSDLCPICKTSILNDGPARGGLAQALPIAQRASSPPTAIALAVDSPHPLPLPHSQDSLQLQSPASGAMEIPLIPLATRAQTNSNLRGIGMENAVELESLPSHTSEQQGENNNTTTTNNNNSNKNNSLRSFTTTSSSSSSSSSGGGYSRLSTDA